MKPNPTLNPDQELLDFAKSFSEKYTILSAGEYFSKDQKYHISYFDELFDNSSQALSTNCRVSHSSGIMEFSKKRLMVEDCTPDFVFFLILWLDTKSNVVRDRTYSDTYVDAILLEYYLTTGRSVSNLIKGYADIFSRAEGLHNQNRMVEIQHFLHMNSKK